MNRKNIELSKRERAVRGGNTAQTDLVRKIRDLKKAKNALVLAHYYQLPEIQEIADMVGDSLQMAEYALKSNADMLVVAGVYFMGETAKILNPSRKVVIPDISAGCSLADSCPADKFAKFIAQCPGAAVVTYINCSAEVKAMSDIVCTSSNAVRVINSLPANRPVIFAPDANLGAYLIKQTGRNLILWDGSCMVHESFSIEKILTLYFQHPNTQFIAHPESSPAVLKIASFVGSTKAMIDFVKNDPGDEFIVATEAGIIHQMRKEVPGKLLIPAPSYEDNKCACSECSYMKQNTLQKLYQCLLTEGPEIVVKEEIRAKAELALQKMLSVK